MLRSVLDNLPGFSDPNVMVGFQTADDAGVYRLDDNTAVVQTLDFFTPVVDDPYLYGQIAAANSLSDVYAMGGVPRFALSIVGFPKKDLDTAILRDIVRGGADKLVEAKVPLIGGHSVQDPEIKFGYAVTGTVHPGRILSNAGARPGDRLVLTKPIGTGIITTGVKFQKTPEDVLAKAVKAMLRLNQAAAEAASRHQVHAATDITGYGLLGHAYEVAKASSATLRFEASRVPLLPGAEELAREGMLPGGIENNRAYAGTTISWNGAPPVTQQLLLDPQTSGGLLLSVDPDNVRALLRELRDAGEEAAEVGEVLEKRAGVWIDVV